jgi:hypothetical protein
MNAAVILNADGQTEVVRKPFIGVTTELLRCDCVSEYQDKEYGPGKRVHNRGPAPAKGGTAKKKCTVCGKVR